MLHLQSHCRCMLILWTVPNTNLNQPHGAIRIPVDYVQPAVVSPIDATYAEVKVCPILCANSSRMHPLQSRAALTGKAAPHPEQLPAEPKHHAVRRRAFYLTPQACLSP